MSVHSLNSIAPLLKTLKRNVRRWFMNIFFIYLCLIGIPFLAKMDSDGGEQSGGGGTYTSIAAGCFLVFLLVVTILYFKNIRKNAVLKSAILDYEDVKKVDMFVTPYRKLLRFARIIFFLDIVIWPITFPLKFVFWIHYRRLKSRIRRMSRLLVKGERTLDILSMENDPFYDFLMREGLYEAPKPEETEEAVAGEAEPEPSEVNSN